MEINVELENLKKEVQRKIGRNVLLFQRMELALKHLLANGKISGYASELQTNQEQRTATIHKQTMGQVVGQFLESSYSASEETTNEPEELKEGWISHRFTIDCDDLFYEERKNALASLVTERNYLIHHSLLKWDCNSFESVTAFEQYLDQQGDKILPEFELLSNQIKAMQEANKILLDFHASGEFEKFMGLSDLRESELVAWLIKRAKQKARSDGWVVLTSATHFIRQQVPEEFANLKERYNHKNLKGIILATEFFDISEEQTDKGGIRVLYRIKPDLNLQYCTNIDQ